MAIINIRKAIANEKKIKLKCNTLCIPAPKYSEEIMGKLKEAMCRIGGAIEYQIARDDSSFPGATIDINDISIEGILKRYSHFKDVIYGGKEVPASNRQLATEKVENSSKLLLTSVGALSADPVLFKIDNIKILRAKGVVGVVYKGDTVNEKACFIQVFLIYRVSGEDSYEQIDCEMRMCLAITGLDNVERVLNEDVNIVREAIEIARQYKSCEHYAFDNPNRLFAVHRVNSTTV